MPGGLGGWVTFVKKPLLAPLELTIGANERIAADGSVVTGLDEAALRESLKTGMADDIEALTICFINAYINGEHEQRAREIAQEFFPNIPISISSEVVPEMQEYERTETTVVNSYVRPEVARYVNNLQGALNERLGDDTQLSILRSDGGLASSRAAAESPVNLLMSGPAGGVTGALFFCTKAGFSNILTLTWAVPLPMWRSSKTVVRACVERLSSAMYVSGRRRLTFELWAQAVVQSPLFQN